MSSFIDSSGYASGLIRRCLFIDYIIVIIIIKYILGNKCSFSEI